MTTTINLSDEALFGAIVGSGALVYPWYIIDAVYWELRRLRVRIADGDLGATTGATLTPGSFRRSVAALVADNYPALEGLDWSDPEVDSGIDADIADCVLQHALLGEVIYG